MYADLTRMMMPAQIQTALVDQSRRVLSFNKQVVDWQLATVEKTVQSAQKQLTELVELSADSTRKNIAAVQKLQDEAVEAWTPAESAEA